ncbi:MAG TPA: 30S ribosomal protein S8 [Alphaproteobacteria bacterium]|nr:30S ribosomal protein S8 [Alphaproteobacteria bacterium]
MSLNDLTSDMVASIRNGQQAKISEIAVKYSTLNENVLKVLQAENFIKSFETVEVRKGVKSIKVNLAYYKGEPVIKYIKRVSKPGLRQYSEIATLPKSFNGLGIKILSTSKGVLSDHDAKKANVGGEVICEVF